MVVPRIRASRRAWRLFDVVAWSLMGTIAVLQMWKVQAGWVTSYGADLLAPGYLFAVIRAGRAVRLLNPLRRSPVLAAGALFLACVAWEWGQNYGLDPVTGGSFDPIDVAAYAVSIAIAYAVDRWIRGRAAPATGPEQLRSAHPDETRDREGK